MTHGKREWFPAHEKAPRLSRRGVLIGLGGLAVGGALAGSALRYAPNASAAATGTLNIPTLLTPTDDDGVDVYSLTMQTGTAQLRTGLTSSTAGFNGSYLGPVIKVDNGDRVRMEVTNNIGAETTVHWHGAHIPPSVDGGPQNIIAAGTTWSPEFDINQEACTLWFHPHGLTTTAAQVALGLAGMILVDDDSDGAAALPNDYGVNQFPLIVQSVPVNSSGVIQSTTAGLQSTATTFPLIVNGANVASATPTLNVDENRVRFHVLNGSITDIITVSRSDGGTMTQVATDAALLPSPTSVTSVRLVAGERAEIVLDLSGTVTLQATVTAGGARGGSGTSSILTITTADTTTRDALPSTLNTIAALDTTGATTRTMALSNTGNTMFINGISGTTMEVMEENMIMTTLDAVEVWTITNATNLLHSFHLHDVPFQVLAVNGSAPTGTLSGTWRDTIEIPAQSTRQIAMKFTDYADDTYGYMLHCHNAIHEDEGMMLMLMVM
ncbi:multicopper oxidase family protein [Phytohabitans rumicis]|uniref:Multicopper oxidase CueO n=1 Tax=Phytohabitans rumicis TaxID=1076125 RepID=A0A6V8L898_9ACTN|nr:multicopper oxidase domain-containing protein [Phytohabitans rumicis]GFJ91770.1 multicopper oxidase [Phytohabitans rumicis]